RGRRRIEHLGRLGRTPTAGDEERGGGKNPPAAETTHRTATGDRISNAQAQPRSQVSRRPLDVKPSRAARAGKNAPRRLYRSLRGRDAEALGIATHERGHGPGGFRRLGRQVRDDAGAVFGAPVLTQLELPFPPLDRDLEADDPAQQRRREVGGQRLGAPGAGFPPLETLGQLAYVSCNVRSVI